MKGPAVIIDAGPFFSTLRNIASHLTPAPTTQLSSSTAHLPPQLFLTTLHRTSPSNPTCQARSPRIPPDYAALHRSTRIRLA